MLRMKYWAKARGRATWMLAASPPAWWKHREAQVLGTTWGQPHWSLPQLEAAWWRAPSTQSARHGWGRCCMETAAVSAGELRMREWWLLCFYEGCWSPLHWWSWDRDETLLSPCLSRLWRKAVDPRGWVLLLQVLGKTEMQENRLSLPTNAEGWSFLWEVTVGTWPGKTIPYFVFPACWWSKFFC